MFDQDAHLGGRGSAKDVAVDGRFSVNSIAMFKSLAFLAQRPLLPVLPDWHTAPRPVYALTETRLPPAKTQRFIEFLQERLKEGLGTLA